MFKAICRFFLLCGLALPVGAMAQTTCTGNFGDPVVNITFGSNNVQELPGTTYKVTTATCPDDGDYKLASSTSNCFSTWHTVTEDHTPGDVNGFMMIVNASIEKGDFFKQTIRGLCQGTTYEFSAFVMNAVRIMGQIRPNLTFTVEDLGGNALAPPFDTGDISETTVPTWRKFGITFKANANEVVLRITNNAPGGIGNDLILDDISFRPCGPKIETTAEVSSSDDLTVCEGNNATVKISADVASFFATPGYQWQINEGHGWKDIRGANNSSLQFEIERATVPEYKFRVAVAEALNISSLNCRIYSDSTMISVDRLPVPDAGEDAVVEEGKAVLLNGSVEGLDYSFLWTPSAYLDDPTKLNPVARPIEDITYTLTVFSQNACTATVSDEVLIRVVKKLIIPNTFSPNGDNVNDYWNVVGLYTYPQAQVKVYNRYGSVIFNSNGYEKPWDGMLNGKPVATGTYYYVIDLKQEQKIFSGALLIVR